MTITTHLGATLEEAKRAAYRALGETAIIVEMTALSDGRVEVKAISKEPQKERQEVPQTPYSADDQLSGAPSASSFTHAVNGARLTDQSERSEAAPAVVPGDLAGLKEGDAGSGSPARSGLSGLAARVTEKHRVIDRLVADPSEINDRPNGTGLHKTIEKKSSEEALRDLRGHLTDKLMGRETVHSPFHLFLREKLSLHGLSEDFIDDLNTAAEAHIEPIVESEKGFKAALIRALDRVLSFSTFPLLKTHPLMLVGQTGAGKTSSVAKIAALAACSGQQVTFFTADTSRAGAIDQIATYAEALNTQFRDVDDPAKISQILDYERPEGIVVLDTPGISPFAAEDLAAIRAFRDALKAEPVLVLPASGDAQEHLDWVELFKGLGVKHCIITKFDTSKRIGAAVNAAYQHKLHLAYFSETPFIADGIMTASARYLADRFLISRPARLAKTGE